MSITSKAKMRTIMKMTVIGYPISIRLWYSTSKLVAFITQGLDPHGRVRLVGKNLLLGLP